MGTKGMVNGRGSGNLEHGEWEVECEPGTW